MAIVDYGPLWETMERNNVTQYQLLQSGIDNHTLDSLKKNRNITMITLEKLCRIIGCTPVAVIVLGQYEKSRAGTASPPLIVGRMWVYRKSELVL